MKKLLAIAGAVLLQAASPGDCAPCHAAQTASFGGSRMTHALATANDSSVLATNRDLSTTISGYFYQLKNGTYTVSNGNEKLSVSLAWAFGSGRTGQTYLFEYEGRWRESRVSYYPSTESLDLTIGAQSIAAKTLADAAGRLLSSRQAAECFDCHAADAKTTIRPGVQCERCHGPSQSHIAGAAIKSLKSLTSEQTSNFCGQCHRTWSQVTIEGPRGIQNLRFQPYRLTNSKCYDAADSRIACTACHNPHQALATAAAFYDAKCLACHSKASKHICKVARADCASCHMPRLELPGAHAKFTDHRIRVVKPGERYPD